MRRDFCFLCWVFSPDVLCQNGRGVRVVVPHLSSCTTKESHAAVVRRAGRAGVGVGGYGGSKRATHAVGVDCLRRCSTWTKMTASSFWVLVLLARNHAGCCLVDVSCVLGAKFKRETANLLKTGRANGPEGGVVLDGF